MTPLAVGLVVVPAVVAVCAWSAARTLPYLICEVRWLPFVETITVPGVVDTLLYDEMRAPTAPYERQITWLAREGAAVREGEIVAQFDVADVEQHLWDMQERVTNLVDRQELEVVRWNGELYAEEIKRSKRKESLALANIRRRSTQLEPPLLKEINEIGYSMADGAVKNSARRIKQKRKQRKVEIRRRAHHIVYRQSRADRDTGYLAQYTVRAPRDSIVVYPPIPVSGMVKKAEPGDLLSRGQPFARLPDFSSRILRIQLEECLVNRIETGARLRFRPRAFSELTFDATVTSIANLAAEGLVQSHRKFFEVLAEIEPNAHRGRLKPGMVVRAEFLVKEHGAVYAVPRDLTRTEGGHTVIQVVDRDGRIRPLMLPPDVVRTDNHFLIRSLTAVSAAKKDHVTGVLRVVAQ